MTVNIAELPPSSAALLPEPIFSSFWMGGFESACHLNKRGRRVDMLALTHHDVRAEEDYSLLQTIGIRSARDGVRWPLIEPRPGTFDFSSLLPMLSAAQRTGTQIVWSLCHYGVPRGLRLLGDEFVPRFARFALETAKVIADNTEGPIYLTPINEISYFAWAAGKKGFIHPYFHRRAWLIKRRLVEAAVAAMEAIRDRFPTARFVHTDPVVNVVASNPFEAQIARREREYMYEAWDMIAGRTAPELGGRPELLDIIGINFYHNNQFDLRGNTLRWTDSPRDERWIPLHQLLTEVATRYTRPLIVAETSHVHHHRPQWIDEVTTEVSLALHQNIPLHGVCLYPIIDRPDWVRHEIWHGAGLWEVFPEDTTLHRIPHEEYMAAFINCRNRLIARHGVG